MGWESDAALAGTLYKKSKPYTAMLIARCVEPGTGGPRTAEKSAVKTSLREFADMAGINDKTVRKYLDTWDVIGRREPSRVVPSPMAPVAERGSSRTPIGVSRFGRSATAVGTCTVGT